MDIQSYGGGSTRSFLERGKPANSGLCLFGGGKAMELHIERVEHHSEGELIEGLRNVTLLERPTVRIYKDACISLEKIAVECLYPAQRYVLVRELLKVRRLRWELSRLGYDMFELNGYLRLWLRGNDKPVDLLPPIVEESIEQNGHVVHIINDGMHRIYLAYREWIIPQVVFIRGIPKNLPYYAYPNPGRWSEIELIEEIPENYIKKWHRIPAHHTLYRNFNSAFENVGAPRGRVRDYSRASSINLSRSAEKE